MKKRTFCLAAALLLGLVSSCQRYTKKELVHLQIVDRNGYTKTISDVKDRKKYEKGNIKAPSHHQKVVRIYDREDRGVITLYHDNGLLWQYLETKMNRAHGVFEEYYPSGALKISAFISEGIADVTDAAKTSWVFDGESKVFDEEGNTIAVIPYKGGKEQGVAHYFYSNGELKKVVPYVKGKIHGVEKGYSNKGELLLVAHYKDGEQDGESFFKGSDKEGAYEEVFINGRLVYGEYKDMDGSLFSKIENSNGLRPEFVGGSLFSTKEYQDGKIEGKVTLFAPNRTILSTYYLAHDKKDGEEILYYPSNQGAELRKKLLVTWKEGVIHGKVSTWYPNGIQESEREMCDHKKEGASLCWYEDSSLMMIEEYAQDKLVNGKYLRKGDVSPISRVIDGMGTAHIYDKNGILLRKVSYYNGSPAE
ncbi:hypothetical protein K0U07_04250 [bacterium]|nr:hypothetical protein [bacterium]